MRLFGLMGFLELYVYYGCSVYTDIIVICGLRVILLLSGPKGYDSYEIMRFIMITSVSRSTVMRL